MTLHDCFLEIAFEAELNTKEDPECLALAPELCNEDPLTRDSAIDELREMIYERGECNPYRTDDAFLLKFLRARKFVIKRAHRLLVNYCKFKTDYPHLYDGVDLFALSKVKGAYEGSMLDHPDIGRLSVFRFGVWDPSEFGVEDLVKAGLAMVEIGLRQPKLQILGGTAVVDFEGISMRHVTHVTPSIAYQIVNLMGDEIAGVYKEPVRAAPLRSFLNQRASSGFTSQSDPARRGEYYFELRIYNTREIERLANSERWKHSIVTLKLTTDLDTSMWKVLTRVVEAGKQEFKEVQPILYPNNPF